VNAAIVLQRRQAQGTAGRVEPVEVAYFGPVGGIDLAGTGAGRGQHITVFRVEDDQAGVAPGRHGAAAAAMGAVPVAAAHADAVERALTGRLQVQVECQRGRVRGAVADPSEHAGDAVGLVGAVAE